MPQPQNGLNAASGNRKRSLLQTALLMSLGRLFAVCLFVGIGIGAGVVGMSSVMKWYARHPVQPIPAKDSGLRSACPLVRRRGLRLTGTVKRVIN